MRGVGVEHRAHPLRGLVDLAVVVVLLAALEHEVLEEVGHAVLLGALRARARLERHENRHRAGAGELDAVEGQPVRERGGVDLRHAQGAYRRCASPCRGGRGPGRSTLRTRRWLPPNDTSGAAHGARARRASASVGDPVPGAVIDFRSVTKNYPSGDIGLEDATFAILPGEFVFLVGSTGSGKSTIMRLLIKEIEPTYGSIHVAGRDLAEIRARRSRTTAATSAWSSRTSSCCRTGRSTTTSPTRCRSRAARAARSATRCRTSCASPASRRSCTTTPTSSRAASSSASRSRARSSTTRRCCWPTSRPATSTPRRRSGSCSCSTGSTARARPWSSRRTTRRWSTACAAG